MINPQAPDWRPSRREVISIGLGMFVVAIPLARWATRPRLVRRTLPVMGTMAEIAVVGRDEPAAHAAIDAAFERLSWVERVMTRFDPSSDVGRANIGAAREPVAIHAETAAVLTSALQWAELSGGRFDPCLGKAVQLWDVSGRTSPPAGTETVRFAGRGLHEQLELGSWRGSDIVRFHANDLAIDLGGIAKGRAVDMAVQALREHGVTDGFVSAGGDLYALGNSDDGGPWQTGVRSPSDPRSIVSTIGVSDRAIATSGDYEAYYDYRGRRYHHLLDPETGEPRRTDLHTVTVAADDCMTADAAATACFGLTPEDARRVLGRRAIIVHMA
ncbi:MAG: FAD:protein FMN transferase [Gemmatimonadota bacterium]